MTGQDSTVAVVMFNHAPLFETSAPMSVFGMDRSASGAPKFTVLPVAAEEGPLQTTGGLRLAAPYGLDDLARAAIVVVPSWRDPAERPPEAALAALRVAHERGAVLVSLCLGVFVLAATGILDGRRAAAHWFYAREVAARYPKVTVDPGVLYLDDGDVLTAGGTGAALDACLHLVRRRWGASAASAIARRMAMPPNAAASNPKWSKRLRRLTARPVT